MTPPWCRLMTKTHIYDKEQYFIGMAFPSFRGLDEGVEYVRPQNPESTQNTTPGVKIPGLKTSTQVNNRSTCKEVIGFDMFFSPIYGVMVLLIYWGYLSNGACSLGVPLVFLVVPYAFLAFSRLFLVFLGFSSFFLGFPAT